jgi:hypothetical protein
MVRLISLYGYMLWSYLPNIPAVFIHVERQFVDLPTGDHNQEMLTTFILPASAGRLDLKPGSFPGEVQRSDHSLLTKVGGDFNGFHHFVLGNIIIGMQGMDLFPVVINHPFL